MAPVRMSIKLFSFNDLKLQIVKRKLDDMLIAYYHCDRFSSKKVSMENFSRRENSGDYSIQMAKM